MDLAEQIRVLEAAQGDPAKLTLATVDLAYSDLPESKRAALTESLEATAIPHWCDANILTALLDIPSQESADRLARLSRLSVVEPFRARGENAPNVHESNRIALRKRMAAEDQTRFGTLSGRAATYFASDPTAAGKIEWIYHLLCSESERGATELENLNHQWSSSAHPEDQYALASALAELEQAQMLKGRARVWVLLVIAWTRVLRGEEAQLVDEATRILDLARSTNDRPAEGNAQCLLGSALRAQGKLAEAKAAFGDYLTISKGLAEQDPGNAGWQRNLAVAQPWMGDVLGAQGELADAQAAFEKGLTVMRRLSERDPSNPAWQCELAVAQGSIGSVLRAQGKLAAAEAAFEEYLAISRRLAEQDPGNAGWQRQLAAAQSCMADVLRAQGKLAAAEAGFGEYLTIMRRLAERDPSNSDWQRGLASAQSVVGDMLQAQGKPAEAQAAFGESLTISRRLAEHDPSNADWQRDLALASWKSASLESKLGRSNAAIPLYEEASRIFSALLKSGAISVQWVKEKEAADSELRSVRMKANEE